MSKCRVPMAMVGRVMRRSRGSSGDSSDWQLLPRDGSYRHGWSIFARLSDPGDAAVTAHSRATCHASCAHARHSAEELCVEKHLSRSSSISSVYSLLVNGRSDVVYPNASDASICFVLSDAEIRLPFTITNCVTNRTMRLS
jgi:hypothetical protein